MKKNIGSLDRTIRIIVGIVILGLGLYFQSWWGLIGLVPLVTAVVGWCPPYSFAGVNTCRHGQCKA